VVILAILDYRLALAVGTVHTFLRDSPSLFYISRLNCPAPLPFYPAYAYLNHQISDLPQAAAHQEQILSLPLYPELTFEQIEYIINSIKDYLFDNPSPDLKC